ncbi:MAG: hypothetical protein E7523_02325 [Ruminococcaceae bacterium]|nr:hypothetical protein [Oscillospiraceae bacterium]
MKKVLKRIFIALLCVVLISGASAGIFFLTYTPTLTFDVQNTTGPVTSGASGYLYGLAENGVPSAAMCESVDISSVSQKAIDGLQHPIGDIDHVEEMLIATDYNVVYLQDAYDTWYYLHDEIMQMRAEGTYDWQKLLDDDFLPKVRETVAKLSAKDYGEKVVYCLYNECDNGVWFGETRKTDDPYNRFGVWAEYNTIGRDNFNSAWKQAFDVARKVNPDCLIGGPGFCDYDHDEIEYFLRYCVENNCVPDIMIYHELHDDSVYYWQDHVDDYRAIEDVLGIDDLTIIVTEYGRMQDNGYPGKMVQYITKIEDSKVYANNAYWRLSNNLNDVCADDNSPNANWWLMRWYADMEGETLASESHDLFKSDLERSVRKRKSLDHQGFMGIASLQAEEAKITAVCGGRNGEAQIVFNNLKDTVFEDKTLLVTVEETVYKGLYGIVNKPVVVQNYTVAQKSDRLVIAMKDMDEANAYHVTVTIADDSQTQLQTDVRPVRYEFEHGTLLGNAYLYDSYCPTSGELQGMVGGMENIGDGVALTFTVPEDGIYTLDFVYGNSNDGGYDENGKQDPDGRVHTQVQLYIDEEQQTISLPNTIKSEYTSCYTVTTELSAGEHTVKVMHQKGTYVLDSLLVCESTNSDTVSVLPDADRSNGDITSFLVIAPTDGYYTVYTDAAEIRFTVDGAQAKTNQNALATVYCRRGLNYFDFNAATMTEIAVKRNENVNAGIVLNLPDAVLENTSIRTDANGTDYIDSFVCNGGSISFAFNAERAGDYRVTLLYSNNDEGGVHDYNVDLIERYVTVVVNGGQKQNVFCRNTYSWETFKTVTFNVNLMQGKNTILFTNDGSVRFNGNETYTPYIAALTVNPAVAE